MFYNGYEAIEHKQTLPGRFRTCIQWVVMLLPWLDRQYGRQPRTISETQRGMVYPGICRGVRSRSRCVTPVGDRATETATWHLSRYEKEVQPWQKPGNRAILRYCSTKLFSRSQRSLQACRHFVSRKTQMARKPVLRWTTGLTAFLTMPNR